MRTRCKPAPNYVSRFTLLICLLTTSLSVGCQPGGIRIKSWDEAVSFSQEELKKADERSVGDSRQSLEDRLEGYARTAADLSRSIEALEQARPALDLIAQLRDVEVPLIGNGWQILLALLSVATVDGAKIIAKLEEVLRELTELKDSLDGLSGLPDTAAAIRAFRTNPNRRSLAAWADASAASAPHLAQLHKELEGVLDPLKDVSNGLSGLVKGLRGVGDVGIPVVSDTARQAGERIGAIEEPLFAVCDGLEQMHQDIKADGKTLENIQEAVRQARESKE